MSTNTFFCNLSVPILVGEDRYKYVPIVGVFRSIPIDQVDELVMHPDGRPPSDRELLVRRLRALCRPPDHLPICVRVAFAGRPFADDA